MRKILSLAIALALPAVASAADHDCLVSFSGAQHNVCTGEVTGSLSISSGFDALSAIDSSTLRLVKFDGPIHARQRRALELAGARIIGYAPHYAYIVRMPATLDAAVAQIDGVSWTGPFEPALKIDPNIHAELEGGKLARNLGIDTLSISLDTADGELQLRNSLSSIAGLKVASVYEVAGERRALASFDADNLATAVRSLAMRDDVLSVGFRKPVQLHNSQGHWLHQSNKNSPQPQTPVWDRGLYGCGQIVGALDSGLWMDNVAFRDSAQPTPIDKCSSGQNCAPMAAPNLDARKVISYYKWSGLSGNDWYDYPQGHGTHVAGSIIGNDNVSNPGTDCSNFTTPGGGTNLEGMAPGAKLVMQEAGDGLQYLNNYGGGIYHAADVAYANGARIHSNSWGGSCTYFNGFSLVCEAGCTVPYDSFSRDADLVMSDHDDLLVVVAAGNDGVVCSNGNNVGSPGNAKNIISVGATGRGAQGNNMTSFSSRGPTLDSRTKPDLTAQGNGIISANTNASGTRSESGTSMATPTVSGLAALVRDYLARGYYPHGEAEPANIIDEPSGALIKAILTAGAFKMTGTGAGAHPGQVQGFGRVHLDDSLYFDGDERRLFIHDDQDGVATGGYSEFDLEVNAGEPLNIVLAWTDAPGAVYANPAVVNTLRLEVKAPNGDVWTQKLPSGYNVNNADPTQGTGSGNYDTLNNVHRIAFDAPEAGVYSLRVVGANVPEGPQKFALAATGDFDISEAPDFSLAASPASLAVCAGDTVVSSVQVRSRFGFDDPVTLSVSGLPGSASGNFAVNPVTPADPAAISELTLGDTGGLARGDYSFVISGASTGSTPLSHTIPAELKVSVGIPSSPSPSAPADGGTDVPRSPNFQWSADAAAESYTIEIASDSGFNTIVASETVQGTQWTPSTALDPMTTYYWRVKADSACGDSNHSQAFSFTTGYTFPEPYCDVAFSNTVEPITLVRFSGIDNRSSAAVSGSPALEDFLNVPGGEVEAGESYTITVEGNTDGSWTNHFTAYIDWNRTGSFTGVAGTQIGTISSSTGEDGKQASTSIQVPVDATPGPVRMRVTKKYNSAAPACNMDGWGQAEDYTLMVVGDGFTVGGEVSGVSGAGLELLLNGGAPFPIAQNGSYVFPDVLGDGESYEVTVNANPPEQVCTVSNGSGTIQAANVENVDIECVTQIEIFSDGFESD